MIEDYEKVFQEKGGMTLGQEGCMQEFSATNDIEDHQ